ncbi:MAG: DinB family protein [Tunicatimonas sp.]
MDKSLEILLQHRKVLYYFLKQAPLAVLNEIPAGFRNNILWNIGHSVVTQQMLVYRRSGLTTLVDNEMIERYRRGSVPDGQATADEVQMIQKLLFTTVEKTSDDYQLGLFREYDSFVTATNVTLANVSDAILFNNYHEGLHLGTILALQKALSH